MSNLPQKEVKPLKPFTHFCCTIGNLPSSYLVSMSYEEQLLWLCQYLSETVIPAVNNEAEAVIELQNLYIELRQYVDNYFDDLNIQDEIDNKLDDMAESGELVDIIGAYLETQSILAFNTLNDLKNADNLIDGTFTKTYGKNLYNDGEGEFYKIREKQQEDVIDEIHIIALTNYEGLIAELMPNKAIADMQYDITTLSNQILTVSNSVTTLSQTVDDNYEELSDRMTKGKYIFFGDSYASGEIGSSWLTKIVNDLKLTSSDYYNASLDGSGFTIENKTFESKLDQQIANIQDKDSITNIVVAGGYNDGVYSNATRQEIEDAINSFVTKARRNFKNAKIQIAHIGWCRIPNNWNALRKSIRAYKSCSKYGAEYLNNTEYIMHDYSLFKTDNFHPNDSGTTNLAYYLANAIKTGSCDVNYEKNFTMQPHFDNGMTMYGSYELKTTTNNGISTISFEKFSQSGDDIISTLAGTRSYSFTNYRPTILFDIDLDTTCYIGQIDHFCDVVLSDILEAKTSGNGHQLVNIGVHGGQLFVIPCDGNSYDDVENIAFMPFKIVNNSLYC